MARYFYIKDDGTATGENGVTTTQRTGAFGATSAYYATWKAMAAAVTTMPTDGDIVFYSDQSNYVAGSGETGTDTINANGAFTGAGVLIVSVDDTNQDQYKTGAIEDFSAADKDYVFDYTGKVAGVSFYSSDNTVLMDWGGSSWHFQDLTIKVASTTDLPFTLSNDAVDACLINVDIGATTSMNSVASVKSNSRFEWLGGTLLNDCIDEFFSLFGTFAGANALIKGVDLSALTTTFLKAFTAGFSDKCTLRFEGCQLNSGITLHGILDSPRHTFEMYNCDDSTGGSQHRFYFANGCGTAQNNDSVYVTDNQPWFEGSNKSSIKVTTTALCSSVIPFVFTIPSRYVELAAGVSDTVSINLVTDFTITDTDIAFFIDYADGTTAVQRNWLGSGASGGGYGASPLSDDGTALNTTGALTASDWTGEPASPNFYKVNLDTSVDAGSASVINVRCEVYKTSITGTTNTFLYIDPILAVGT